MKPLCVCLFLVLALSYASGCSLWTDYEEKTFDKGVYVSVTSRSYTRAFFEFLTYSRRRNDQYAAFRLGPLIVQVEKPCEGRPPRKLVFSRRLPDMYINNPPQPYSNSIKIDYQLGSSAVFYSKKYVILLPSMIGSKLVQFMKELSCDKKSFQDKWFYVMYKTSFPFGLAEIRLQKMTRSPSKNTTRCPPDDSNIEELCKGDSGYSCPNMTFEESDGVAVRNVSMYVVTGEPTTGVNCSFDLARFSQYMGNHHYFMGENSQSKKMRRTIPVMTKAIRISSHEDPCQKKYQMQFYVNTAHLNESNLPCPTQAGVMLQKVENMQLYVKTFNGNPDTDMSQAKDMFTKELDGNNMNYINGNHYIAQYRGHGPMFGRTMEIWVEKTVPQYVTVCQGTAGTAETSSASFLSTTPTTAPQTSSSSFLGTTSTTAPQTSSESIMISYY